MAQGSPHRFAVVRRNLEDHGWRLVRIHGSHHKFEHSDGRIFSIPVHHNQVKACYVRKIEKLCSEDP